MIMVSFRFTFPVLFVVAGALFCLSGAVYAQTPAPNEALVANVTVLAVPGDTFQGLGSTSGDDQIVLTYRRTIPRQQAYADIVALDALRKLKTIQFNDARGAGITNDTDNPASVQITASGIFPAGATRFDVEPFIIALKHYKRIRLLFASRQGDSFTGLRDYSNQYVHISFDHSASTYEYFVTVVDPNFTQLNLPVFADDPAQLALRSHQRAGLFRHIEVGVIALFVIGLALLVGFRVYVNLNQVRNAYNKAGTLSGSQVTLKGSKNGD